MTDFKIFSSSQKYVSGSSLFLDVVFVLLFSLPGAEFKCLPFED